MYDVACRYLAAWRGNFLNNGCLSAGPTEVITSNDRSGIAVILDAAHGANYVNHE
ncbi:hypothetical protein Tco_1037697, partial [Tanacetum coccineum]